MDLVRVYDHALDAEQIEIHYTALTGGITPERGRENPSTIGYWKLDETSGTSAEDESIYENDGTLTGYNGGAPSFVSGGVDGYCAYFNPGGSDTDYIQITQSDPLKLTQDFVIDVWVKCDTNGVDQGIISKLACDGSSDDDKGFALVKKSNNRFAFITAGYGTSVELESDDTYTTTEWNHIVIVHHENYNFMHINGEQQTGSTHFPIVDSGTNLMVGLYYANDVDDKEFNGYIDEIVIRGYHTGETEINDMGTVQVAHWTCLNSSDTSKLFDESLHEHDGTLMPTENKPDYKDDYFGKCLEYDGANYVEVTPQDTSLDLSNSDSFTISVWVKCDTSQNGNLQGIINRITTSNDGWALIKASNNKFAIMLKEHGSTFYIYSDSAYTDDDWHQIKFSRQSGTNSLYVDGSLQADNKARFSSTNTDIIIGALYGNSVSNYFKGRIDSIKIQKHWRNTHVGKLVDIKFESGTYDSSLNGNDLNLEGATVDTDSYGCYLDFNLAQEDYAYLSYDSSLDADSDGFEISLWFRITSSTSADQHLVGRKVNSGSYEFDVGLYLEWNNPYYYPTFRLGEMDFQIPEPVSIEDWHFISGGYSDEGQSLTFDQYSMTDTEDVEPSVNVETTWDFGKIPDTNEVDYNGRIRDIDFSGFGDGLYVDDDLITDIGKIRQYFSADVWTGWTDVDANWDAYTEENHIIKEGSGTMSASADDETGIITCSVSAYSVGSERIARGILYSSFYVGLTRWWRWRESSIVIIRIFFNLALLKIHQGIKNDCMKCLTCFKYRLKLILCLGFIVIGYSLFIRRSHHRCVIYKIVARSYYTPQEWIINN